MTAEPGQPRASGDLGLARDLFQVQQDEKSHVLQDSPSEDLRSKVEEAARSCPTGAISLHED
ncbi:MAG: ferredoxin [Chloroflexi bacterium]|nr:MAG: ferredoxin [Chloroflexota bacterium]